MLRLLFLSLAFPFFCFSINCNQFLQKLDQETKEELEQTLRHLIAGCELGYLIYGNKPVCMLAIDPCALPCFRCQNPKNSIYLERFCELLETLNLQTTGNFLIRRGHSLPHFGQTFQEVLFINRKNFLDIVNKNLILFQYILGPEVTAEGLLTKLLKPEETLFSVLNTNFALVGIVLGYGTQNALFYHRRDLLNPRSSLYPKEDPLKKKPSLPQAFGHQSPEEEFEYLQNKIHPSRNLDIGGYPPLVIFGYVDHKETTQIIEQFSLARKQIRSALSRPLLEEILPLFFDTFPSPPPRPSDQNKLENTSDLLSVLSRKFAQQYAKYPSCYDDPWKTGFFEGLQSPSSTLLLPKEHRQLKMELQEASIAYEQLQNLKTTAETFQELGNRTDLQCLVPGKLYSQTIQEGNEPLPEAPSLTVSFSYRFKDFEGTAHSGRYDNISISEFIPGISKVLREMKLGEIRSVWIHPDYGSRNDGIKPSLGFRVRLELFEASPSDSIESDPPIVNNTEPLLDEPCPKGPGFTRPDESELSERLIALKKRDGYDYGAHVGRQLRFIVDPTLAAKAFQEQTDTSDLSPEENDLLYRLHLSIFSKQKKEEEEAALRSFKRLPPSVKCLTKNRLYIDLLEKGTGEKVKKTSIVEVRQLLKNHLGDALSQTTKSYDLRTAIRGYQEGLAGQSVGSKIKLYIHPEWGYRNFPSTIGDTFLIAEMEILSIR